MAAAAGDCRAPRLHKVQLMDISMPSFNCKIGYCLRSRRIRAHLSQTMASGGLHYNRNLHGLRSLPHLHDHPSDPKNLQYSTSLSTPHSCCHYLSSFISSNLSPCSDNQNYNAKRGKMPAQLRIACLFASFNDKRGKMPAQLGVVQTVAQRVVRREA